MSKKTKMSLQELAKLRGFTKPEVGCSYDNSFIPRDYEQEAKDKKASEEAELQARLAQKEAKKAAEAQEVRLALFNKVSESTGFPVCFTDISGVERGWFIFACRDGVPFFHCHKTSEGDFLVPEDLTGITFNAYKYADEFFLAEEVGNIPLDESVELWRSTGHYTRHWVMNYYKEGRGRTVIQVLNNYYPGSEPAQDWHWNDRDA